MAHFAVGFFALGLLTVVMTNPGWFWPLLLIPVALSTAVVRYRTVADRDTVTARYLLSSETTPWSDIDGLRFDRASWAIAQRRGGSDLRLPAVTFGTLPLLTEVSGGRVPNPYA